MGYDYHSLTIDQIDEDANEQNISPARGPYDEESKSMVTSPFVGSKNASV